MYCDGRGTYEVMRRMVTMGMQIVMGRGRTCLVAKLVGGRLLDCR